MGNRGFCQFVLIGVSLLLAACSADLVELPGFGSDSGSATVAPAGGGYRAYAAALLAEPRSNVKFRPDLESYLDGLAAATRRSSGYRAVAAGARMKEAARAQALDMALGGYVGHESRNGYRFGERFAAFADPAAVGYHGENAARDRQPGSVDQVKARRLFGQWLDSSGHRRNLLNPAYAYVATGAVQVGHALYAVQIFWQYEAPPATETSSSNQGGAQFY
jgi:uncharacterized protein YkwD